MAQSTTTQRVGTVNQNCGNCAAYYQGTCRRHSPQPYPFNTYSGSPPDNTVLKWPPVSASDWCYEWASGPVQGRF